MSSSCPPLPDNPKKYIQDIGVILVKDHGKKKYYQPQEVRQAHKKSSWYDSIDFSCWAMSIYSSHSDFDDYHESHGESCDYVEMKTEVLHSLGMSNGENISIPDIDVDTSWLDFGDISEDLLGGVGEFFGTILSHLPDIDL